MNALPYIYIPPDVQERPLLVSVPHAGLRIPEVERGLVVASEQTMRQDADLHVDRLYQKTAEMGGHLLVGTVSRYVLDLNRAPDDVDDLVCSELKTGAPRSARALIWRESTTGEPVQARRLTSAEVARRVETIHQPYHQRLRSLLDGLVERHGYAILLDAHSMPSVGRVGHKDHGRTRANVVPGDNHGQSCDPSLTRLVVDHFEQHDLTVAVNDPYSGGWITRNYGAPQAGVHAIQIELSRAMYLHEEVPWWAGAPALELRRIIESLLSKLMAFRP